VTAMHVAAVTVNWNQPELTQRCVASLLAGSEPPRWIIVVDNGSAVDPTAALHALSAAITVIRNPRNLGFAAAVNQGVERACVLGATAVLLINNDATAEAQCLAELVAALASDERRAGVGAKVLTAEEPPRIHTAYGTLTYHGWLVQQQGWLEPDITRFSDARDVDYISGCAMLVRRDAWERVGPFDAEFFAYHEDLDWCTRARRAGYRVTYIPSALVHHRMHASTGGGGMRSPIGYLSARNSILFVRKNATWAQRLKFGFYLGGHLLKEAVRCYRIGELPGFWMRVRGLRDGLLGRPVPLRFLGLETMPAGRAASTGPGEWTRTS